MGSMVGAGISLDPEGGKAGQRTASGEIELLAG